MIVKTQKEFDAAYAAGEREFEIVGFVAVLRESSHAELRGSSSAVLMGSSSAVLWESSSAVLWGSSSAELWGSSSAELWGSSSAELWGSSRAELRGSSRAELRGSSSAVLMGSSRAVLRGSSHAELWESSSAVLMGSSHAVLRGSSSAVLMRSSHAELRGSSRAVLWESSSAVLWESSRAVLRDFSVVHKMSKNVIVKKGQMAVVIIPKYPSDMKSWCKLKGIKIKNNRVRLWKCTNKYGYDFYTGKVLYNTKKEIICHDWEEHYERECGHAFHLADSPQGALFFCQDKEKSRLFEMSANINDCKCFGGNPEYPMKIRAKKCRMVKECPIKDFI